MKCKKKSFKNGKEGEKKENNKFDVKKKKEINFVSPRKKWTNERGKKSGPMVMFYEWIRY